MKLTLERLVLFALPVMLCFQKGSCDYSCYSCEGGPESQCANVGATGVTEFCNGRYCYEAFVLYQNGAMPMVLRRCWQKPNDTTETNFCKWVKTSRSIINSHATVVDCRICDYELCNTNKKFWESRK